MITRLLWLALIAFVLWWMVEQPSAAAHAASGIGRALYTAASGFSRFLSAL